MPFNIEDLGEKVLEDIHREKAQKAGLTAVEQQSVTAFEAFKKRHEGLTVFGGKLIWVTPNPYALVVQVRCPWYKCRFNYRVIKFVTRREGEAFYLCCPKCKQNIITLRDAHTIYGTNTYPVLEVQKQILKHPAAYQRKCRMLMVAFMAWVARARAMPRGKVSEIAEETADHRAITIRSVIEEDEDTREHLNQGYRKREIKKVWGI